MNTKAIIAGTILSASFAATSAIAEGNDYLTTAVDTTTATQTFVIKHAYLLTTTLLADKAEKVDETLTSR